MARLIRTPTLGHCILIKTTLIEEHVYNALFDPPTGNNEGSPHYERRTPFAASASWKEADSSHVVDQQLSGERSTLDRQVWTCSVTDPKMS